MILGCILWAAAIAVAVFAAIFIATTWNGYTLVALLLTYIGAVLIYRAWRRRHPRQEDAS